MTKFAVTVGIPHDPDGKPEVITGPEVPFVKQKAALKKAKAARTNPDYREMVVMMTAGGGRVYRAKWISPEAMKRRKAAQAKADAAAKAATEKAEPEKAATEKAEPEKAVAKKTSAKK